MLKKVSASAIAMLSLVSFAAAAVNFDNPSANNFSEEMKSADPALPVPSPAAAEADKGPFLDWLFGAKPVKAKEWTIMVFVNGKNNLEQFALKDINEMEMVGSSDKVNIVVEAGRMDGYDSSDGDWKGTRRYLIKKDNDTAKVTSPVVKDMGKVDMGDYKSVIDFGKWAKAAYPANHYMLVIWNHGAGWIKSNKAVGAEKGISYDDETNNHINTPQMGQILRDIGGVDLYGSDACLMQMAEVVYELKDYVKFIVGSEETEPGDGYTYNDLLGPLVANPAMTPEAFAKVAVNAYANHYQTQKEGSTQSYIRSSAIPGFLSAVNDFASAMTAAGEKDLVKKSMAAAQAYAYPENKDLYHFTQLMLAGTKSAAVKEKGTALMSYISNTLVGYNRTTNGQGSYWAPPADYSNSHGVAIYMPPSAPAAGYDELQWAKYSGWDEFKKWYQQP